MNRKIVLFSLSAIFLSFEFLLCRYVLFYLHGMKDWPKVLFVIGLMVILFSVIFNNKILLLTVLGGYILGFVIGYMFQSNSIHQGGSHTVNNMWEIWTIVFFRSMGIGLIGNGLYKRMYLKNKRGR